MLALVLEPGREAAVRDVPAPTPAPGEVSVRVLRAGVCATDLALARGYMGFQGIPGHEFVGVAEGGALRGRRVVGEINAGCGACPCCARGDPRHCARRSVLGILARPGAFAERLTLPEANLCAVPDEVATDEAVFVEPLAAALAIPAEVSLAGVARALVVGDGRLGLLCAQALAQAGVPRVALLGRHPERAALAPGCEHRGDALHEALAAGERWPLVVEASGRPELLASALRLVRPRGTLVLKTTAERPATLDLAPLVVDEIRLVGSRCGRFAAALEALRARRVRVQGLIAARYPLAEAPAALAHAARGGTLKVLLDVGEAS